MSKIIIAGGGHGGITAAIHLAKNGYDVTIFEKETKSTLGPAQTDAVDKSAFDYAKIPIPDSFKLGKNEITFVPSSQELGSLTIPPQSEFSVIVDRKELISYLFSLAEENGAVIHYDEEVVSPIILGNRVVGVKTQKGEYLADLVIDACGVNSPIRNNLPDYMGVNREIKNYDILYSYRVYFDKKLDAPQPKTNYNIFFKDDGTVGFRWLITENDRIDALVCRFYKPTDDEISAVLADLRSENPQMGSNIVYGGIKSIIPVCQPLALIIANGYAAIGDSAFMTFSVKGSGIAYSLQAGKILAKTVTKDTNGCFDREHLWDYQRRFFKEIGLGAAGIAIGKNLLPYMLADDVNRMFELKLFTNEELSALFSNAAETVLSKKGINTVREKLRILRDEPRLKELFGNLAKWLGRYFLLQAQFPNKYDTKDIDEWVEKYNKFFDEIRYGQGLVER